ncbi:MULTISPECIES: DUF3592 domain-containing protein [Burkholderia]|jgi:hypothetical protein|uniref:DUF3592 domain-containing protein n=3 Tax=Burkholderia cenocepacia TaxID=95486 RepID=A0A1D2PLN9_9BURK|nr:MULTISPECIES: DUF3592 domain-containing protein [Burkholderia]AIO49159.1 hypothetical protein DM42_397 [Burkholderia cepacia]AMU07316.1 hypothetical protein A2T82_13895 [Burkholderia cenocepacia]AMU15121.1 hypothetical protein A3203_19430 [Burkholderia cenocepacia]AOK33984.1 hypothetical protein WL90_06785 [Burkholderia cenocepacia]AQQ19946.1 hypothetical protein A8D61_16410 [Burkholderia cenocepacia]
MFKGISAIVIGVGLLVAAAISAQSTREFLRTSIVVPGLVVKLNAGGYHPEIQFTTKTGQQISYPQGGIVTKVELGQRVEVRYQADDPDGSATMNVFAAIWDSTIVFAFMGAVAIVCGIMNLPSRT